MNRRPSWRAAFSSLRVRLILSFWLLGVAPLGLLGWFMLRALDQFYVERLLADMRVEAGLLDQALIADLVAGQPVSAASLVGDLPLLRTQARFLIFDSTGQLLSASGATATGLTAEPGLSQALLGVEESGLEQSPALSAPVAYVAHPILSGASVVGVLHLAYPLTDIQAELSQLRNWILLALLLLAMLTVMVSLELTRRITEPLDRLRLAAQDIGRGRFDHRLSEAAPTELADVARGFNQMAQALTEAEQARQAMFANLAHDIRTPLGSIRAAAEALNSGAAEQPELRERFTTGLITQIGYLRRLTDDLLRLAAYEGGGLKLNLGHLEIAALLRQAEQSSEPTAQAKSVQLAIGLPEQPVTVLADSDRLLEALLNLLDNALQYTPAGGHIQLTAEAEPEARRVRVSVRDTGPGLPPDLIPHLFDRYRRGDLRRAGSGLNMGLGLSIAQTIVSAHGGALAAANLPEGGAEFFFWLPLA